MNTKPKSIAKIAAELADNPSVEQEVQKEIDCGSLVSHLLNLRISRGITQERIAQSMGCDPSKISRIEAGNDANLKWMDIVGYVQALDHSMTILFEDPKVPAAQRIKECVMRIHEDLETLTTLACQVGGNDDIAKKIHQFSGEVLMNFLIKYRNHSERLRAIVGVPSCPTDQIDAPPSRRIAACDAPGRAAAPA